MSVEDNKESPKGRKKMQVTKRFHEVCNRAFRHYWTMCQWNSHCAVLQLRRVGRPTLFIMVMKDGYVFCR